MQRNEDCTGWDLTPRGEKKPNKNKSWGLLSAAKRNNWVEEGSTSGSDTSAVRMKHFPTQEETKLQLRCEGGRCWDLPKRCWKTGSQHRVTQLLFSCQTTNTNRQLGFWLAWIQIETKTQWEHTPWKHAWKTVELDWIYSIFQLFVLVANLWNLRSFLPFL